MSLHSVFKRASGLFVASSGSTEEQTQVIVPPFVDGEVIFCKNNVCVHPPTLARRDLEVHHHPGYLSISVRRLEPNEPTLVLSWIPNATLKANPWTVEKRASHPDILTSDGLSWTGLEEPIWDEGMQLGSPRRVSSEDWAEGADVLRNRLQTMSVEEALSPLPRSRSDSVTSASSSCTDTKSLGPDELPNWMVSPEMLAVQHNLVFPESVAASPVVRRKSSHRCRRFTVDLSEMRSLRLLSSGGGCEAAGNEGEASGQLVVASRESQYKILHFHHGGLRRLGRVLAEWSCLLRPKGTREGSMDGPYLHFLVCRPEVSPSELHPEEGRVSSLNKDVWLSLLTPEGNVQDDLALRKAAFFGGLEPSLRSTVWPFLLRVYSFQSTTDERHNQLLENRSHYDDLTRQRRNLTGQELEIFYRTIECVVEKDVVRTDRTHSYFAGDNNPHLEQMKNILLNYAFEHPKIGYTQGMSDLLAPVLVEVQHEADAYACFVNLMQKALFVCSPTDSDMDLNLNLLRELIRLMSPSFYKHIENQPDAAELLFAHRWILLCFKREFNEECVLQMWEACWANYLTDFFHLFLSLAIVCVYGADVVEQMLRPDEMLLHFSSLAMHMDGQLILSKARGLLYQFRRMPVIPCSLRSLCQQCGPGVWDSTHAPDIECVHSDQACPHAP
ncbi:TBC1 domain family member 16 [Neocloeon triangulifer]|uniref:TBC1 domain family member 16 n=1 Tax=Neocloeon triangulifer TaxID=2078957 RepID=UPI00286F54AF|nr:TBC1 domain family member 16 [Neocloeon triangulifer]